VIDTLNDAGTQRKPVKADDDDLEDEDEDEESSKKRITTFELNDTLYAEAELEDTDTVYLWLGVSPFVNRVIATRYNRSNC
jgi:hypothetical protein